MGSSAPVDIAVLADSDRFVFGDSFASAALADRLAAASKPALADSSALGDSSASVRGLSARLLTLERA